MEINEINKEVQSEINQRRIQVEAIAVKNLEKANKLPAFSKLVQLEKDLIFEIGKADAFGKKTTQLKAILKDTQSQKHKLLQTLGLTEADLVPQYSCKKCKDVGFIGTIACDCFLKERSKKLIENSGFDTNHSITFETFDSSVAKTETQKKILEKLKTNLLKWCNKFPDTNKKTIILTGNTGVGKTYASQCIANKMAEKGFSVCVVTAFQMNQLFLNYHTTFNSSKSSILVPLTDCDVLVVDDLGTEPPINNVTVNYLYLILSERERLGKATIITTNLSPEKLKEQYGERIYSRLLSKFSSIYLKIAGDDLRN